MPDPRDCVTATEPFDVPAAWDASAREAWHECAVTYGARELATNHTLDALRALPGGSCEARAAWALRTAQDAGYVPDPDDSRVERFQPVLYTLAHGGDCEDLVDLFRALARLVGVTTRGIVLVFPGRDVDHATAQAWLGPARGWVAAEPSLQGAQLGEQPSSAAARFAPTQAPTGFVLPGPVDDLAILWLLRGRGAPRVPAVVLDTPPVEPSAPPAPPPKRRRIG